MKWLRKKVIQWVRDDWDEEYKKNRDVGIRAVEDTNLPETDPVLTFRIYGATNGKILEFRHYDRKNDRNHNSTYIIEKDKDIGEYVSKCLSLEMLK
jgi:HKD family nuclease